MRKLLNRDRFLAQKIIYTFIYRYIVVIIVWIFQSCVSHGTTRAVILVVLRSGGRKIKTLLVCTCGIFGRHARVPGVLVCVVHHQQILNL
jgi:hypothetical protein